MQQNNVDAWRKQHLHSVTGNASAVGSRGKWCGLRMSVYFIRTVYFRIFSLKKHSDVDVDQIITPDRVTLVTLQRQFRTDNTVWVSCLMAFHTFPVTEFVLDTNTLIVKKNYPHINGFLSSVTVTERYFRDTSPRYAGSCGPLEWPLADSRGPRSGSGGRVGRGECGLWLSRGGARSPAKYDRSMNSDVTSGVGLTALVICSDITTCCLVAIV